MLKPVYLNIEKPSDAYYALITGVPYVLNREDHPRMYFKILDECIDLITIDNLQLTIEAYKGLVERGFLIRYFANVIVDKIEDLGGEVESLRAMADRLDNDYMRVLRNIRKASQSY